MLRHRSRLVALVTALTALWLLAAPASSPGFQTVTIEGDTLHIVGDNVKKPDEVTITYDYFAGEYVIGHDINMTTAPAGCHFEGSGPPYKVLRCPIKGIKKIRIEVGIDRDKVDVSDLSFRPEPGAKDVFLPPELTKVDITTGPGADHIGLHTWLPFAGYVPPPPPPPPRPATVSVAATGTNPAATSVDTGIDVDTVSADGGTNTVAFGASGKFIGEEGINTVSFGDGNSTLILSGGTNSVSFGDGNGKASVSGGTNQVSFGAGNSTYTATGGTNVVSFGAGKSVFIGGSGSDAAIFGAGNNTFMGGAGDDSAELGAGNDSGSGGAGADAIRGGCRQGSSARRQWQGSPLRRQGERPPLRGPGLRRAQGGRRTPRRVLPRRAGNPGRLRDSLTALR